MAQEMRLAEPRQLKLMEDGTGKKYRAVLLVNGQWMDEDAWEVSCGASPTTTLREAGERLAVHAESLLMLAKRLAPAAEALRKAAAEENPGKVLALAERHLGDASPGRSLLDSALDGAIENLLQAARNQAVADAVKAATP